MEIYMEVFWGEGGRGEKVRWTDSKFNIGHKNN